MSKKYLIIVLIVAAAAITGTTLIYMKISEKPIIPPVANAPLAMEKGENKEGAIDNSLAKMGLYGDYSAELVAAEQKAGNKVVLFFHAPWCPYCRAADAEFKSRGSEIPVGVTVLKIDYDSNKELRKKYGLTYQHTFVQIDSSGNMVTKWVGGDIDNLIRYIK